MSGIKEWIKGEVRRLPANPCVPRRSCTETVGAKVRGGDELAGGDIEVKRRIKRKKRGAEQWSKERMAVERGGGVGEAESDPECGPCGAVLGAVKQV